MNIKHEEVIYWLCLCFRQSLKINNYVLYLLIISTSVISYNLLLVIPNVFAQEEASVSLNKNIIYVNSKSGNDSQVGDKAAPFRTITHALKQATPGSTIQLVSGTYSEETGETFPLVIDRQITIQGNQKNQGYGIFIKGGGDFTSPTGAGQNVAIAIFKTGGKVAGLTVTNNHSRGHGLWLESSSSEIVSNTFTRNGNTGVSVNGKSSPTIENNYFYNNSGNGLLVYGASEPKIIQNTFEQTGFGVSLVQNAISTLTDNYFDGNRIGIILEGNAQAILRDNEIVNSSESGLTAIAQSRVDLGTSSESGNNIFRSNKKLDIQNATNNEIVAVGTQTNGNIDGNINFDGGDFIASVNVEQKTRPLLAPLGSNTSSTSQPSLPSPPPVSEQKATTKELVFTPSSAATLSETPEPQPVPFLPQINNSALGGNSSQIGSLSDVLGSNSIKYKVLVEAADEYAQRKVRSLYPEAFNTIYQGKSVLQIGAFNSWDKAKQAKRSLEDFGFDTYILE